MKYPLALSSALTDITKNSTGKTATVQQCGDIEYRKSGVLLGVLV